MKAKHVIIIIIVYLIFFRKAPAVAPQITKTILLKDVSNLNEKIDYLQSELEKSKDNNNITVDTYSAAVPYFTGTLKRTIYVRNDSDYNEGEASFYTYHPELGVAFLGLDYNYKSE